MTLWFVRALILTSAALFGLLLGWYTGSVAFPDLAGAAPIEPMVVWVVLTPTPGPVETRTARWTAEDVHEAIAFASPLARCIVTAEIGGVGFDPYAVSRTGDVGPAQLNAAGGLLREFLAERTDPFSPRQSVDFVEEKITEGRAANWAPVKLGICA